MVQLLELALRLDRVSVVLDRLLGQSLSRVETRRPEQVEDTVGESHQVPREDLVSKLEIELGDGDVARDPQVVHERDNVAEGSTHTFLVGRDGGKRLALAPTTGTGKEVERELAVTDETNPSMILSVLVGSIESTSEQTPLPR